MSLLLKKRSKYGFTIIEVLISLAILTIILGAIYSSFFISERAIERFEDVSLKYHEARTALDIMHREIEGAFFTTAGAQPVSGKTENRTYFLIEDRDILGKPVSRLRLTAFSSQSGIVNAISYYVEEKDGRFNLLKTESPIGIKTKEHSIEMIEDIESFTVETLVNNKWIKTWDTTQTNELPDIVRVGITFNDKGKEVRLTEYARPKIGREL